MKSNIFFVVILINTVNNVIAQEIANPVVITNVGTIQGVRAEDGDYNMFMGIPYARVDDENPFGDALPYPEFEGVFTANDDSAICPQIEEFNFTTVGSLDCLHLNVYSPSTASSTNRLPVMVYIYGGMFSIGFAGRFLYGPQYFVRHEVILVTLNYRLGPYGFMCLDSPEVPGNQGMKDQVKALRWINENIEAFGGDVNRITVFGNSAGGMAGGLHLMYANEKLFTSAIMQSGTEMFQSTFGDANIESTLRLAAELGLTTENVNVALEHIIQTDSLLVIEAANRAGASFGMCVEKTFPGVEPFITGHPINMAMPRVEGLSLMVGFNNDEMAGLRTTPPNQLPFLISMFNSTISNNFDFEADTLEKLEAIVRRFYIGDDEVSEETLDDVVNFAADTSFVYSSKRSVHKYLDNGAENVFFYKFSYVGERNFVRVKNGLTAGGASHADEIGYLFDMQFIPGPANAADQLIIDRMTTMWANFAKYGDPTPETSTLLPVKWEPIKRDSSHYFLEIDTELNLGRRVFQKRMAFWDLFYKGYGEYERGLEREEENPEEEPEEEPEVDPEGSSSSVINLSYLLGFIMLLIYTAL